MTARHHKRWLGALALACATSLLAACGGESLGNTSGGGKSASDSTVKVGLLVAKSGVYATVGKDMENGFKLYLEQHGQKLGGKKVQLVEVDEGDAPQSGVAGATRLVQQDRVDVVVGIVAGPTATGSADIFDANKVPVLMGNTGAVSLAEDKASPWIWRASYDNRQPGQALAPYLAKELPNDKFYLVAADYSGGHETIDGFKEGFPKERIAGEAYTPFGTTSDFSPFLAKIRQSGAKAVFCFYAGREAIDFTKQFHQFGLSESIKLYSAGFLNEGSALQAEGDAALGIRNSTRYNWDLDNAANKAFAPKYQEQYGTPPTVFAATMYDIGTMLDKALAGIDGDVSPASINEALGALGKVDGVRGSLEFDDTRTVVQDFYLTEVQKTAEGLRNVTVETLPRP